MVASSMPIEPPDPTGKILDNLRAALAGLQAVAATRPGSALIREALIATSAALLATEAFTREPTSAV
jgi:hypothetical protein